MYYKVAPSVLAADFAELGSQLRAVSEAGAEWIHLDVMDGAFVPSISFGMPVIKSIRRVTDRVFDVHMMVEEPGRYVEDVKKAGADVITVHAEACKHLDRVISQIKEAGCRAGVALNPATPVSVLEHILDQVDMVLIMTVNPGFGGQKFIPYTIEKVKAVRRLCDERGLTTDITGRRRHQRSQCKRGFRGRSQYLCSRKRRVRNRSGSPHKRDGRNF